jgi:hypothetical protein
MSDLYDVARDLQATNLVARKLYAFAALATILMGAVSAVVDHDAIHLLGVSPLVLFFGGLLAYNERLIRRMRKAGF